MEVIFAVDKNRRDGEMGLWGDAAGTGALAAG